MKIDNTGSPLTPLKGVEIRTNSAGHGSAKAADQPASDQVQESNIALSLQPDVARLERLREAVRNGTYSVPAADLSSSILNEHLSDVSKHS